MLFEIKDPIAATLVTWTPRNELHGEESVHAVSMGLRIVGPSSLLDLLDRDLRDAIYHRPKQKAVEGVAETSQTLRTKCIDSYALNLKPFEGWTLNVDHGIDEEDPYTFGGCKIDKFRVSALAGGTVEISLRVGTSDIDAERSGAMHMQLGEEIMVTLIAPRKVPEKDKPTDGKPSLTPTDVFAGAGAP